ncbi:MAG: ferritin-like domain-containing protein [Armatimonadetes bacterium]|nr:ferritin-like domain-containing protein [Armatimonadota bacterium]
MPVKSMEDLYVESLRDLYSAESQLVKALPKVADTVSDPKLRDTVLAHLEVTKGQKVRLEQIFAELGEDPEGHECAAMKGLIKEADELMGDVKDPEVLDAALIGAAQKVEHYEMSGYGTARTFAQMLGHDGHADLLQSTLDEEKEADSVLTRIATNGVNRRAKAESSR